MDAKQGVAEADASYSEILRRFPMLKMLDTVSLTRVVFPIDRQPKEPYNEQTRSQLAARPFTFPADAGDGFAEYPMVKDMVDSFCQK